MGLRLAVRSRKLLLLSIFFTGITSQTARIAEISELTIIRRQLWTATGRSASVAFSRHSQPPARRDLRDAVA